jgi:uncharacterized protein involved in exopolysaccharide biosynthesis
LENNIAIPVSSRQYEDEIDLLRYGQFLASYWRLIAGGVAAGAVAAFALASLIPPRFQATATMTLSQPGGATPLVLTPASARALLTGLVPVSEVVRELGLDREGMTTQAFIDDALEVQPVPTTGLVKLSVTLRDPSKARLAATLLATKVIEWSRRIDREGAATATEALEKQLALSDASLKNLEKGLLDFEMSADIDKLEAEVRSLPPERRQGSDRRMELYRRRIELDRLHTDYMEHVRVHSLLAIRYEDARGRPGGPPQIQMLDAPIQPDHPVSRRRPQFAMLGALIGLVFAVVAALVINKRLVVEQLVRS